MSESDQDSTSTLVQALQRQTALSRKPSAYVFDPKGDTKLTLHTFRPQVFNWKKDTLWIDQKRIKTKKKKGKHQRIKQEEPFESTSETNAGQVLTGGQTDTLGLPSSEMVIQAAPVENVLNQTGITNTRIDSSQSFHGDVENLSSEDTDNLDHRWLDCRFGEMPNIISGHIEVRMLVSGKHLGLASRQFQRMLTGPYSEAKKDAWNLHQVTASDWDPDAFRILFDVIHGYHRDVPRSLSLEMFAKLVVVVDYYECHESIDIYIDIWLKNLERELPKVYGRESMLWMLISWVLSRADTLQSMAHLALQYSSKLIEVLDLPIPADLLSELNGIPRFALMTDEMHRAD